MCSTAAVHLLQILVQVQDAAFRSKKLKVRNKPEKRNKTLRDVSVLELR